MNRNVTLYFPLQDSESSTSWINAKTECQKISGALITISDQHEQSYAEDEAVRYLDNVWIGLTEMVIILEINVLTWTGVE